MPKGIKGFQKGIGAFLGYTHSTKTRNKISSSLKGRIAWNKNIKINREKFPTMGHFQKHTMETKLKMSLAKKGIELSEEHINKLKGRHFSPSTEFKKGDSRILGNNNHNFKDGKSIILTEYRMLHRWVERNLGKASKCEKSSLHQSTRYHWANISGEYLWELSDWIQLCPSCNLTDGVRIQERFRERGLLQLPV